MKFIILINILFIVNASNNQKCFVCDNICIETTSAHIQNCSDNTMDGKSGEVFVSNALNYNNNNNNVYDKIADDFNGFVQSIGSQNATDVNWKDLTHWVCYTSKDKRRGCLKMAKGLCMKDNSVLGKIWTAAEGINNILKKSANFAANLFTANSNNLNDTQKQAITTWFATDYMSKLVNNSNLPAYQLESCCEGDQCNSGSIHGLSITLMITIFFYLI